MRTNIELKNQKIVAEKLRQNIDNIKKGIKTALDESGKIVEAEAKRLCPVDTGKLKESIKASATFDMKTGLGITVTSEQTDPYYAQYVEYGTIHQRAQPFMRPAIDNNIEKIKENIDAAVSGALEDV